MLELDPVLVFKLKQFIKEVLLPPNGFITLALVGIVVARLRRRAAGLAATVAMLSLLAWFASASSPGSTWLMSHVESQAGNGIDDERATQVMQSDNPPQAIVVLGGGTFFDRRERPHRERLSALALERVHAAARIARWTRLPVATTGGKSPQLKHAEAEVMARVLREDLLTAVRWIETGSFDTADNARNTASLLRADAITHVFLVTQAFHMARSRAAFEAQGIQVTPAPVGFMSGAGKMPSTSWVPRIDSRERAAHAWRELIGQFWYWLNREYLAHWFARVHGGPNLEQPSG